MKLNFKVAFLKEKNDLPLLQEVLSKGGFMKPAQGLEFNPWWDHGSLYVGQVTLNIHVYPSLPRNTTLIEKVNL